MIEIEHAINRVHGSILDVLSIRVKFFTKKILFSEKWRRTSSVINSQNQAVLL